MTDFAVTGKKRSGKGLFCAALICETIQAGKRVATNMDIYLENVFGPFSRHTYLRLPDCPTADDMEAIGKGNDEIDDSRNGIIVLDEASKYFNARAFGDKSRQPLLDWLIHSGKLGWDVYYQMQGLSQVDKQLRETQVEYHVSIKRTDRWPIPGVTQLSKLIGLDIRFPRMHIGTYRHGVDQGALVVDRKFYRAHQYYKAYDTRQVFLDRTHPDACGLHTVLSPWHIIGRHIKRPPPKWLIFLYGVVGYDWITPALEASKPKPVERKPKHPLAELLMRLPESDRLRHWRRLDALGAFTQPDPARGSPCH